jgi:hypothetical protein
VVNRKRVRRLLRRHYSGLHGHPPILPSVQDEALSACLADHKIEAHACVYLQSGVSQAAISTWGASSVPPPR